MADESDDAYFGEREGGIQPADLGEIGTDFWGGLVALVTQRIGNNAFAESFPVCCSDTGLPHDTDFRSMGRLFKAEVRNVEWPLDADSLPCTTDVLEAAEFFWRSISEVGERRGHSSPSWGFQHHHFITFNRGEGQDRFRKDVNRLLRRCRHPYFIDESGRAMRRLVPTIQNAIRKTHFRSGDDQLDRLMAEACEKFQAPDIATQRESLERIWDAWERLKSALDPDKARSAARLLNEFVSEPRLRARVESDARDLNAIGNELMIRHTEVDRPAIATTEQVDYLFLRLFALVSSIMKSRGWAAS